MAGITSIGWCDSTLNPFTWHCKAVSPGCANCFARTTADRWHGAGFFEAGIPAVKLHRLLLPFTDGKFRAGLRIFLTSMSDPFDARLPLDDLALVWALMAADQGHIYQVLTKRHPVMRARLTRPDFEVRVRKALDRLADLASAPKRLSPERRDALVAIEAALGRPVLPLPNVLLGISAENRTLFDRRVKILRQVPAAARRFVSAEPLLSDLGDIDLTGIDWLIIGGESGRNHRPMDIGWLDSIVERCDKAGIPVWVKQDSNVLPEQQGRIPSRLWRHEHCDLPVAA